jgi:hypothetical protein
MASKLAEPLESLEERLKKLKTENPARRVQAFHRHAPRPVRTDASQNPVGMIVLATASRPNRMTRSADSSNRPIVGPSTECAP